MTDLLRACCGGVNRSASRRWLPEQSPAGGAAAGSSWRRVWKIRLRAVLRIAESVAHAPHRLDPRLGKLGRGELRAQPRDVDVDRARLHEAVLTPHQVEQFLAPEHAARRADQRGEQLELLARQLDRATAHLYLEPVPIDLEVTGLEVVSRL